MGTRITGGEDKPRKKTRFELYPNEVAIGCLNRAHREIVHFVIPRGSKSAKCPVCGRKAGRG